MLNYVNLKIMYDYMIKRISTLTTSLVLSVTAAFAENVSVNEADGTLWDSYTASRDCIRASLEHVLGDDAEIVETKRAIVGLYNEGGISAQYTINTLDFEDYSSPVIESITHAYAHDFGIDLLKPELGACNLTM